MRASKLLALALACLAVSPARSHDLHAEEGSALQRLLSRAEAALADGNLEIAREAIDRALERDASSARTWHLLASWAQAAEDRDHEVHALHRELSLRTSQELEGADAVEARILELDPIAADLFGLSTKYVDQLRPIADRYEKEGWPHGAIGVHKEILVLAPDAPVSTAAIERLANSPDPSLAGDAKSKDLLEGISATWIEEHDAEHGEWRERAKLERDNYVTLTSAGYEVMVRSAEAMEQMSAFYRQFFQYGNDEKSAGKVPRIELRIFRDRDEYLKHGSSPAEWSGGQFTGSAVETYVGGTGFEGMVGTLFHEAAHQFVSLATSAVGWLNEGLASFFEGSRILANGSVLTNLPANHRLFPLVDRLERGWMSSAEDGTRADDPNVIPERAPTLRIVIENRYEWGPAWYAPTWGIVYFLYNYQDPADGRFVYRKAFREYIDRSGGLVGDSAISAFEETVLANPRPVTRDVRSKLELVTTVDDLNDVWKDWLVELRDVQNGKEVPERPWAEWARHALTRLDIEDAQEYFESGLTATPDDVELLVDFGEYLVNWKENEDRAVKLFRRAERVLARAGNDDARTQEVDRWLRKLDPQRAKLDRVRTALLSDAEGLPRRYLDEGLERMAMDVAYRLGRELQHDGLFALYREAIEREGGSLALWQLAYNEEDLAGWAAGGASVFEPEGPYLNTRFGSYEEGKFEYRFLTLDTVTSGDFSMEADVQVIEGQGAFAGLVFGRKSATDFHGLILFPSEKSGLGYADLASFYGGGAFDTWRHQVVRDRDAISQDTAGKWHRLRVDVTGETVDMWVDGKELASQVFPNPDVLRGSFGLMTGLGSARFRNVRFLARDPLDPAAKMERSLRRGETAPTAMAAGEEDAEPVVDVSNNGSWLGLRPPFPKIARWLQGERSAWREAPGSPQLLVLWSLDQNDTIRLDEWLNALHAEFADVDLRVINVVHTWDEERAKEYLESRPFPGVVGVDERSGDEILGKSFLDYAIDQFNVPRLVLVDVDGRVAWEGEPGFAAGIDWDGEESFLRTPLETLIQKRNLYELATWRDDWQEARFALADGRFEDGWKTLEASRGFDAALPMVAQAQAALAKLEQAVSDIDTTIEELVADQRGPAALALANLAERFGQTVSKKTLRDLRKEPDVKAWTKGLGYLKPTIRKLDGGKPAEINDKQLELLGKLAGPFPAELQALLSAAKDDPEALAGVVRGAESLPGRWLATEFIGL